MDGTNLVMSHDGKITSDEAWSRHQRIIELRNRAEKTFLELGKELYEFGQEKVWRSLGYDSFKQYLADPEIDISPPVASKLITVHLRWVIDFGVSPEKLLPGGYNKTYMLSPYLGKKQTSELLNVAQSLSKRDLEEWISENFPKPQPPLPDGEYMVKYADPPWEYNNTGFYQSANQHYSTMSIEDIIALGEKLPPSPILFLWVTSPFLDEGINVLKKWGYEYKASMIWRKNRFPGQAFWTQTYHEILLIGRNNEDFRPKVQLPSVVDAPVSEHSRKPDVFYCVIEQMFDPPYLELFARGEKREGWDAWGNEINNRINDTN